MSYLSQCKYEKCVKSCNCLRYLDTPEPDYQPYNKFQNICHERNNFKWFIQADPSLVKKEPDKIPDNIITETEDSVEITENIEAEEEVTKETNEPLEGS